MADETTLQRIVRVLHDPSIPDAEARGRAMSASAMLLADLEKQFCSPNKPNEKETAEYLLSKMCLQ